MKWVGNKGKKREAREREAVVREGRQKGSRRGRREERWIKT